MRNLWLIFLNFQNCLLNWASVVSNNRSRANSMDLKFIEPTVINGVRVVKNEMDDMEIEMLG